MWINLLTYTLIFFSTLLLLIIAANLLLPERNLSYRFDRFPAPEDDRFLHAMAGLVPTHVRGGNRVELLRNGAETFPAMLQAIDQARSSITFENYIYWSGEIGREFADRLARKAQAGVCVHVLLDWVGSHKMDQRSLRKLRDAGAIVRRYHPLKLMRLTRLNHRTHRRQLIVDGRIGFTGGVGIGDEWDGDGHRPGCRRDNHYRVEGPLVSDLQGVFQDNWLKVDEQVLSGEQYFPCLQARGPVTGIVMGSSPRERISDARLLLLSSIAAARETIHIASAYFVPDRQIIKALVAAVDRGVEVEILVPGDTIDYRFVRWASRSLWRPLLQAGIAIYEYQPTMFHVKSITIDGLWVIVGSSNLDYRSLYRNDEVYLCTLDREFGRLHEEVFQHDKHASQRVTLEQWLARPAWQKLRDAAYGLMRSQL